MNGVMGTRLESLKTVPSACTAGLLTECRISSLSLRSVYSPSVSVWVIVKSVDLQFFKQIPSFRSRYKTFWADMQVYGGRGREHGTGYGQGKSKKTQIHYKKWHIRHKTENPLNCTFKRLSFFKRLYFSKWLWLLYRRRVTLTFLSMRSSLFPCCHVIAGCHLDNALEHPLSSPPAPGCSLQSILPDIRHKLQIDEPRLQWFNFWGELKQSI